METAQLPIGTTPDEASTVPHRAQSAASHPPMADRKNCSSIGNALLREYAVHLDPLNTNGNVSLRREDEIKDGLETLSSASTLNDSPLDLPLPSPSKSLLPLRTPKSFLSHRSGATTPDTLPKHTIAKALVSRSPNNSNPVVSIAATLSTRLSAATDTRRSFRSSFYPFQTALDYYSSDPY